MTDRIDNTALSPLDRHRPGEPVSARTHNQVIDVVDEMRRGVQPGHQVVREPAPKAAEIKSTAPFFLALMDWPGWDNSAILAYGWTVRRQTANVGAGTFFRYYTAVNLGGLTVWPGRTTGWYRSNAHLYPLTTTPGLEIQPRHLRLYRFIRLWDTETEIYVHESYVD